MNNIISINNNQPQELNIDAEVRQRKLRLRNGARTIRRRNEVLEDLAKRLELNASALDQYSDDPEAIKKVSHNLLEYSAYIRVWFLEGRT